MDDKLRKRLLKILEKQRKFDIKKGYSREIDAGFVKGDIKSISSATGGLFFEFDWGNQTVHPSELNLREVEEAIKFLKKK